MTWLYTLMGVTSRHPWANQKPERSQSYPLFVFARQKYSPLIGPTVSVKRAPIGSLKSASDKLRCVSDRFCHYFVSEAEIEIKPRNGVHGNWHSLTLEIP